MIIVVKIDSRERELIQNIQTLINDVPKFNNISLEITNLPLGDVIIVKDGIEKIIIERKTVSDLLASIQDGRYDEQSFRLNGIKHPNHDIMYLIEGDLNRIHTRFQDANSKYKLFSAIFSLNFYKGFSVLRTLSVHESALFLLNSVDKMLRTPDRRHYTETLQVSSSPQSLLYIPTKQHCLSIHAHPHQPQYSSAIKKVKKENVTTTNIWEIMLCQIPDVSSVSAIAIFAVFQDMVTLIETMKKNKSCLDTIQYINDKGVSRKLGKNVISNLFKFLVNN